MSDEILTKVREVVNQHSKDIKKLVEVIENLKTRIDAQEKAMSHMYNILTKSKEQQNPFDSIFKGFK